ncbi:MAG: MATE family efflux transporter [Lachnospiraceae bacterium]|nr:MATE family efflux transporter [Lachnospiraceae bacterium]
MDNNTEQKQAAQTGAKKTSSVRDMTSGSPMKLILGFSVPLLFGNLFQQFYNLVDTMIVGRYLGVKALAGVGSTGSLNFLIIGFCMGVCSGFAIPVSHSFGAKDEAGLRKHLVNAYYLAAAFALVITLTVSLLCRKMLILMRTPEDIIDQAYSYIFIIFLGIPATFLYNILSSMIRAIGDSKTPLFFLVISSFINIGLDILFIVGFKMGVSGAALATVLSQLISGILCIIVVIKRFPILHIRRDEMKPDKSCMHRLNQMGVPMGLQYSITAIGGVILQSSVNTLGSTIVAAITASNRVTMFLSCPFDALGATMATYGGQNVGAKKLKRVDEGLKACSILGVSYSVIAFLILYFFRFRLVSLFIDDAASNVQMLENSGRFLIIIGSFYIPLAFVNIIRFLIQGMGFPYFAILAGVLEMIARTLAGLLLVPAFGFLGACFASPLAWIFADAFLVPAYIRVRRKLMKSFNYVQNSPSSN